MSLFEFSGEEVIPMDEIEFSSAGINEKLFQKIIRNNSSILEAIAPETLIIASEFREWGWFSP